MDMPKESNHGFSLLGRKSLVLSHIPMFMPPHQAQLFLEVTLAGKIGGDPAKTYLDDQAKSKTTNYVLVSDPLVLPTLAPDAPDRLKTFTGKLYRGWPFDTPNTAPVIVEALTVNVVRSIYFHSIAHGALLKDLTYLAFASPDEQYLVHKLVEPADLGKAPKPPDFVQILSAGIEGVEAGGLRTVAELSFPGTGNDAAHRLVAHQIADGIMRGGSVKVRTGAELIYDPNHLTM
jgi:hypothetical protein